MSEVEYPGHTRDVELTVGAHIMTHKTSVSPITGDPLFEVVVVGPTGDCSWGFYVDEEIAVHEAFQLNTMFQTVAAFIHDGPIRQGAEMSIVDDGMVVHPLRS